MNIMNIADHRAIITYDPDTDMLRGEFLGLNGGADFYAANIRGLRVEGKRSLEIFLDTCKKHGIEPFKAYSGKFNARIDPDLHARAVESAASQGISLNQLVERAIKHEIRT